MELSDLTKVNTEVNKRVRYTTDEQALQQIERWDRASEVGYMGDCEDYALEKLHRLVQLGWPIEALRLTFCWVDVKAPGNGHAVLVVEFENKLWVLDNNQMSVTEVPYNFNYIWNITQSVGGSRIWLPCQQVFAKFYPIPSK